MDYYPFGSLKPGRYLSDTTDNCVTLNQTVFVVKEKDTMVWEPGTSGSGGYNIRVLQTLSNPRQVVTLSATMEGLVFDFDDTATSGSIVVVERDLAVTANVAQEVSMGLAITQGTFVLQAVEDVNGNERILASVTQQAGDVTTDGGGMHTQSMLLRIVPSAGNIKLRLSTIPMQVGNRSTAIGRWVTKKTKYLEQQNIAVSLCDSTADRYRFGYSNHEKLNEVSGIGNTIDMGDRWLDTRLGRTPKADLHESKYPFISPYSYSLNNPILYIDPDGKDVHLYLSKKPVGQAQIRLIGNEGVENAPQTVTVDLYELKVTDDVTGTASIYHVTRDAWVVNSADPIDFDFWSENEVNVLNTAFEPKETIGKYKLEPTETGGLGAYALRNTNRKDGLEAEDTPLRKGKATGVMIHVGGVYTDKKGNERITGSLGCFTLNGKDAGNKGANKLVNDINSRKQKNKKAGKGTDINLQVEKRDNVNWEMTTDEHGTLEHD